MHVMWHETGASSSQYTEFALERLQRDDFRYADVFRRPRLSRLRSGRFRHLHAMICHDAESLRLMSAMGHERTLASVLGMSALPLKADILSVSIDRPLIANSRHPG